MTIYSYDDLISLAIYAGFSQTAAPTAAAIALAESGGRSDATNTNKNGSKDYGLWQINSIHAAILKGGNWKDGPDNAEMAYKVYRNSGKSFRPWVTYNSGSYKQFMKGDNAKSAAATASASNAVDLTPWDGIIPGPDGLLDPFGLRKIVPNPGEVVNGTVKIFSTLTDPNFWRRAGMISLGLGIITFALIFVIMSNPKVKKTASTAANVVPVGRAANIAKGAKTAKAASAAKAVV